MSEPPRRSDTDASAPGLTLADRMGPIGYLARIAVAAALGWFTYVLVAQAGPDGKFAGAGFLAHWYFWAVLLAFDVLGVYTFGRNLGGGRRWGLRAVAGFVGLAGVAALVSPSFSGAVWAPPLTWLAYGLWLAIFATGLLLGVLQVILRTPGCETSAIRDLSGRLRGTHDQEKADKCIGLHRLDAWEAQRRRAR